jgi:hypothetical protein
MDKYAPVVRVMKDGAIVVDYGAVWFRLQADGAIVKKFGWAAGVKTTLADRKEAERVRNDLPVKIRMRSVICRKPTYGRFDEYQVVTCRKILSRHDLRSQAERWCEKRGLCEQRD